MCESRSFESKRTAWNKELVTLLELFGASRTPAVIRFDAQGSVSPLRLRIVLWSESLSGKCAKLHTVAASNNRDHAPQSLYYCLFAPRIYGCDSSRTFRSRWIAYSTQRQRRVGNNSITEHKIDNKTRQKHRYNTIAIFRSIFIPRCYIVAHLCFIKYIENCQGISKIFAIFFAPAWS